MPKKIYLDNAATTPVDKKVVEKMLPFFTKEYANASSQHLFGKEAKKHLDKSRKIIAKEINARPREIIFTSGGTESNNLALKGLFFKEKEKNSEKNHIITTKIEHDCILKTCNWLEKNQNVKVTYLNVDSQGFIDLEQLKESITEKTFLVSVIHGNNEIGTIQNLEKIGKICHEQEVLFHTDACQSFTKTKIDVKKQNLDLVTLNSHKIHGPKGVGALYIGERVKITPLMHGGGHEQGLRSGTENIPGIVGFAQAEKKKKKRDVENMRKNRDKLIKELLKIPRVKLNGPEGDKRLCNNVNVSFSNVEGEAIGGYLEALGIYTSTGSACMSHSLKSSHVLKAIGLDGKDSNSSLRISINKYLTEEEINYFLKNIKKIVKKLRRISPF